MSKYKEQIELYERLTEVNEELITALKERIELQEVIIQKQKRILELYERKEIK